MLTEFKNSFQSGLIDKHQYTSAIFNIHRHLFDYPAFLQDSPVRQIRISKEKVLFDIDYRGHTVSVACDGRDAYSLPLIYMNFCETESNEGRIIHELINPGDVVFDIGANIGWYSVSVALKRKDVCVYSFEPIKSSFAYLKENLEANGLKTDKIFNFGFSDKNKIEKFYFDVEYAMASSMANLREDQKTEVVECEVRRLDDFVKSFSDFSRLDFIKCDVEGAELLVFKGAEETLERYKPIVFSEMLRKWSAKFNYHPNDIIELFSSLNYECFAIGESSVRSISRVLEDTVETNYLFLNRDRHQKLVGSLVNGG